AASGNSARGLWGRTPAATGRRLRTLAPGSPWRASVGVAEDVREIGLDEAPPAIVYWPATVTGLVSADVTVVTRSMSVVVRSSRAGTASLSREIEEAVWSVDSRLPISSNRTMQAIYDESLARTSFTLVMLAIAGISALVLGIVGL